MSQWYKKRILKFDDQGNVMGEIDVGAEICGHTFATARFTFCEDRNSRTRIGESRD
jgi:hypothetical protein